jgi:hypothetical protein
MLKSPGPRNRLQEEERKEMSRMRKQRQRARVDVPICLENLDAVDSDAGLVTVAAATGSDDIGIMPAAAGVRSSRSESGNELSGSDTSRPAAKRASRCQGAHVWISQAHADAWTRLPYMSSSVMPAFILCSLHPSCGSDLAAMRFDPGGLDRGGLSDNEGCAYDRWGPIRT